MRTISDDGFRTRDAARFGELLIALGRRSSLRDPVGCACEEFHFTPAQFHAVMWLGIDGALPMGEIAHRLKTTVKTVTGLVDRLERLGLARRNRDGSDRRVVRVALTPKGARAHQRLQQHIQERLQRLAEFLEPADRKSLIRILEKVLDRLGTAEPDSKENP